MASVRNLSELCKRSMFQTSNFVSLLKQTEVLTKLSSLDSHKRHSCSQTFTTERCIVRKRKLFTPGPLMVSDRVKKAMLTDQELRHADFPYVVKFIRNSLLQIAKVSENEFTAIPLSGSGSFGLEGTFRTTLAHEKGKLVVMENGRYGKRIAHMCKACGINVKVIPVSIHKLQDVLLETSDISGVAVVHCETSSGMINPVNEIGDIVKKCCPDCLYFVDAMTSFGTISLNMQNIDFLIGSSYKCLQGVPGVAFVIANKEKLQKCRYKGDGLVLDIGAQFDQLERDGEFLFTPPFHVMLAFKEALLEYSEEGGLTARASRYWENCKTLKQEMSEMGFCQLYKDEENPQGFIVTSYLYPNNPLFIIDEFHKRLSDAGSIICKKRYNSLNSFRISSIGNMYPDDVRELTVNIREVCQDMRIELPLQENNF